MEEDATTEGIEGESEKTQICHTLICHYSRVLLEQNIYAVCELKVQRHAIRMKCAAHLSD